MPYVIKLNDYDYCSKCKKLCDYLDLKPYKLKWYCKKCYIEATVEHPEEISINFYELTDYDSCSKCHKLFDYLSLKPHDLKWYCHDCYKEIIETHPLLETSKIK